MNSNKWLKKLSRKLKLGLEKKKNPKSSYFSPSRSPPPGTQLSLCSSLPSPIPATAAARPGDGDPDPAAARSSLPDGTRRTHPFATRSPLRQSTSDEGWVRSCYGFLNCFSLLESVWNYCLADDVVKLGFVNSGVAFVWFSCYPCIMRDVC